MYKQIIPSTDWFYVEDINQENAVKVCRLAAWGLTDDGGGVHGLFSGHGSFKHFNDLNVTERKALETGVVIPND